MPQGLTEHRDVDITISGGPMPLDAYKAITQKVQDVEDTYANNSSTPDIGTPGTQVAVSVVLTGATPYKVYSFDVYADLSAGTYNFAFVEAAPNVDLLS